MFDQSLTETVGFDSTWKSEKELTDGITQTVEIIMKEQSSNTQALGDISIQTDSLNSHKQMASMSEQEEINLAKWLKKIYPRVIQELDNDYTSNAFRKTSEEGRELSCKSTQIPQKDEYEKRWDTFLSEESDKLEEHEEFTNVTTN